MLPRPEPGLEGLPGFLYSLARRHRFSRRSIQMLLYMGSPGKTA